VHLSLNYTATGMMQVEVFDMPSSRYDELDSSANFVCAMDKTHKYCVRSNFEGMNGLLPKE
jgi:hypothetical protein